MTTICVSDDTTEATKRLRVPSENSPPKNTKKQKEGDCCITCKDPIGDNALECIWCEQYQHSSCAKISADQYSALSNISSNIVFFCSTCLFKLPNALLVYDNINETCSSVENSIKSVETTLSNRFNGLADQVKDLSTKILELKGDVSKSSFSEDRAMSASAGSTTPQHSNLSKTFSSVLNEEREKDKRKLNLILHNVPESTNPNSDVRKRDDTDTAVTIFNQHLGIPTSVSNATRLGKKGTKARLLRVTVSTERDKATILRNSTKVRSMNGIEYLKKLYITPDLTLMEREQNKALRSRLNEMNQQGNRYRIKNGQIVLREIQDPSAQPTN